MDIDGRSPGCAAVQVEESQRRGDGLWADAGPLRWREEKEEGRIRWTGGVGQMRGWPDRLEKKGLSSILHRNNERERKKRKGERERVYMPT